MRTSRIDYEITVQPCGIPAVITVSYEIEFIAYNKVSPNRSVSLVARPIELQAMIGKEPFESIPYEEISSETMRDWVKARASEVSFEACGYTQEEAEAEYYEEEQEENYIQSQTGRPI